LIENEKGGCTAKELENEKGGDKPERVLRPVFCTNAACNENIVMTPYMAMNFGDRTNMR
jgi:hypothetical protein